MQREDLVPIGLLGYGISQVALGGWMAVAPDSFFDALGGFGARNAHYVRDVATWELALGVVAILVARRGSRSAQAALLLFAGLQAAFHTANHIADAGIARIGWVGAFDAVSLGAFAAALLVLWRIALSSPTQTPEATP